MTASATVAIATLWGLARFILLKSCAKVAFPSTATASSIVITAI
jgi:hypothetical protein